MHSVPVALPEQPTPEQKVSNEEREARCQSIMERLRGKRYAACKLQNFVATTAAQKRVKEQVMRLCDEDTIRQIVKDGRNVIFYGPPGTGKDHLMAAMMRQLIWLGMRRATSRHKSSLSTSTNRRYYIDWLSGPKLTSTFRDFESDTMPYLQRVDVLCISDPAVSEQLTAFQAERYYELVDARYSHQRATWITANVTGITDLGNRLSPQIADRLRDGAITVHCNWESYRKASKP